jgi:hypothetical protein
MRLQCTAWAFVLASLLPSVAWPSASLWGVVRENVPTGHPKAGVLVSANGANQTISDSNGEFRFNFPNRKPGDEVYVNIVHKGWVVVSGDQQKVMLKGPTNTERIVLVICPEGERQRRAEQMYGTRFDAVIQQAYQPELNSLKSRLNELKSELNDVKSAQGGLSAAIEESITRLNREMEARRAQAAFAAERLAEQGMLEPEMRALLDVIGDGEAASITIMAALLESTDRDVGRITHRFASGQLSAWKCVLTPIASLSLLAGGLRPGVWVLLEALAPGDSIMSRKASLTLEIGGAYWKETTTFQALPGTRPIPDHYDSSFLLADFGFRYYPWPGGEARMYVSLSGGLLVQPGFDWRKGWAFHASVGVFLFRATANWRPSLELRASLLQTGRREITFDPLGPAKIDDDKQAWRFSPTLRLQVFSW